MLSFDRFEPSWRLVDLVKPVKRQCDVYQPRVKADHLIEHLLDDNDGKVVANLPNVFRVFTV